MSYLPSLVSPSGIPRERHRMKLAVAALFASSTLLLSGCGIGKVNSTAPALSGNANVMHGRVRGGQPPVTGAVISLYAASTTGYPGTTGFTAPTELIQTLVTTDQNGDFSISNDYTCPVGDAEVYLTATGGNPGLTSGTNNASLVLMAALGSCDNLLANAANTFINVDEVSTVAAAYALAPFAAPYASSHNIAVATSPTNTQGLINAMATVNNLVDLGSGSALSITPYYATNTVPYLNSSTAPQARINTLANILASCVNSDGTGSACSNLFTAAKPPNGTEPIDTLQAILDIAQNPGNNVSTLFGLSGSFVNFQPALTTAPGDWQLALTFSGAGLGISPAESGVGSIANDQMAIDATGNILVTASGTSAANGSAGFVAKFNNLGVPLTPATTQPTPTSVAFGGAPTGSGNNSLGIPVPGPMAIDQSGDAWIGASGATDLNAFTPTLTPAFPSPITNGPLNGLQYIAIDIAGNVWTAGIPGSGALGEYSSGGVLLSPAGGYTGGGVYGPGYYGTINQPTFDSTGNLWASDSDFGDLYLVSDAGGQLLNDYSGTLNAAGYVATPLVAGASGNIFACPQGPATLDVFNASSLTGPTNSYSITAETPASRGCGLQMSVDGLGNIWVLSNVLDEFSSTGVLLSPPAGYTATSTGEAPTFTNGSTSLGTQAAVDGSGNIWILNNSTGSANIQSNALVEIVGAAAPVATPISAALQNGEIATRP